jgi:hypothetical protein
MPCDCVQVVRRSLKDQSKSALRDVSHMKVIEYEGGKSKNVGESRRAIVTCFRRGDGDAIAFKGTLGVGLASVACCTERGEA